MTQEISTEVLLEKYAEPGETSVQDVRRRVARGLAQAEKPEQRAQWEETFFQAQENGFVPAGRINNGLIYDYLRLELDEDGVAPAPDQQ